MAIQPAARPRAHTNGILDLPEDPLLHILEFCDAQTVLSLRGTSRHSRSLLSQDNVWKARVDAEFDAGAEALQDLQRQKTAAKASAEQALRLPLLRADLPGSSSASSTWRNPTAQLESILVTESGATRTRLQDTYGATAHTEHVYFQRYLAGLRRYVLNRRAFVNRKRDARLEFGCILCGGCLRFCLDVFHIWCVTPVCLAGIFIFLVMLPVQLNGNIIDGNSEASWWLTFSPLIAVSAMALLALMASCCTLVLNDAADCVCCDDQWEADDENHPAGSIMSTLDTEHSGSGRFVAAICVWMIGLSTATIGSILLAGKAAGTWPDALSWTGAAIPWCIAVMCVGCLPATLDWDDWGTLGGMTLVWAVMGGGPVVATVLMFTATADGYADIPPYFAMLPVWIVPVLIGCVAVGTGCYEWYDDYDCRPRRCFRTVGPMAAASCMGLTFWGSTFILFTIFVVLALTTGEPITGSGWVGTLAPLWVFFIAPAVLAVIIPCIAWHSHADDNAYVSDDYCGCAYLSSESRLGARLRRLRLIFQGDETVS